MIFKLRDYQTALVEKVRESFKTHNKVILVAPCGSGKTVISTNIIEENSRWDEKVWFVVHRKELLDQADTTFKEWGIDSDDLNTFMVQSLKNKLKKIDYEPDMIIFDECSHATSKSYEYIMSQFPKTKILGLTATPTRLSGKPLGDVFEDLVQDVTAKELIAMGYLADYDYYAPKIDVDFTRAKIIAGDYSVSDIDFLMNKPKIYGDIIKNYKKLANNKKTIVYCSSIEYSKKIEQLFKDNGYNAKHFDGNTPIKERDQIIQDFRDNKINILLNVDLIGEGFDVPDCECIVLLRPTQSLALYIQQSTRCLRPSGAKKAVIIDYVGNAYRHGMPTEDREWSLTKEIKCKNRNAEPEVLVRQCSKCFKCYSGVSRRCPYCGNDNGKTRKEIANEQKIELERIQEVLKKQKKTEQGMCRDFDSLVELGKQRGYKNPVFWARTILKSRR